MSRIEMDTDPWYRQFWPWFLISIPLMTILASAVTVTLAVRNKDSLVVDDYYKEGLAINRTLEQQKAAAALALRAQAEFDVIASTLSVQLSANRAIDANSLKLAFVHATLSDQDFVIKLERTGTGVYTAKVKSLKPGNWDLKLEPENEVWRLDARVSMPAQHWVFKPDL